MRTYSHIVIGGGAIGSAAAYWLTERGAERVLVLEQFALMNDRGASGEHWRIIRHAYRSPAYTALTGAMFAAWEAIEDLSGLRLYTRTGGLDLAHRDTPGGRDLDAYRAALDTHGIPYEDLTIAEIRTRYPQWTLQEDVIGLYQEAGGVVDVRKSVSAHTSLALARGVDAMPRTAVTGISIDSQGATVHTTSGALRAERLVVAAGSWLQALMPDLGLDFPLTLSQEQVGYFTASDLRPYRPESFPIWLYHGEAAGDFYGFPVYGEAGVKLGRNMRGCFITSESEPSTQTRPRPRFYAASFTGTCPAWTDRP
jgi:glycine/D-amino acid oxidase-like deaminating enzyme